MRRRAWALLLALLLLGLPRAALAQPPIEQLTLSLLPQYDDPRLLVLYEATLAAPGEVRFAVPAGVELHIAAFRDEAGLLHETEASFEAGRDAAQLRVVAPTRQVRVEFYLDVIPNQAARFVDFTLPAQPGGIGTLTWELFLPPDASAIRTAPAMAARGTDHIGLLRFQRVAGPLPAGERAAQSVEWQRASNAPVIVLPPQSSVPAAPPSLWANDGVRAALALLGLGAALLGHGLWRGYRARGAAAR